MANFNVIVLITVHDQPGRIKPHRCKNDAELKQQGLSEFRRLFADGDAPHH